LNALKGKADRSAYYKAVICLIWNEETYYFDGIYKGNITEQKIGTGGFGYDPVFMPEAYDKTFAELPLDIKNMLSHRGKAVKKMIEFLNSKIN
jgi:XTP/dITP diphosphohydrolase